MPNNEKSPRAKGPSALPIGRHVSRHKPLYGGLNCGWIMQDLSQWLFKREIRCKMQVPAVMAWTSLPQTSISCCFDVTWEIYAPHCRFHTLSMSFEVCFHPVINSKMMQSILMHQIIICMSNLAEASRACIPLGIVWIKAKLNPHHPLHHVFSDPYFDDCK